ncbi:MAG: hypothetical protein J7507_07835 [Pseudoxanthomonas sp.]|nr:hypothetical protein [Pseudoxanthomonas sp.]
MANSRMRIAVLVCVLAGTAGCHRFAAPEARINAAVPVADEVSQARQAFHEQAAAQGFDAAHVDAEFDSRLKMRALECAHGYAPSWLESEDTVRARLTDTACFATADHALAQWLGLRHAGLLLAAPPLRPVPAQPAPYLVAADRISECSFPRQAGIAVLHTDKAHEVFDLGSGQRLRAIPREGRSFVVDVSDNGRLLSLNQDQATVLVDLERGVALARLEQVNDHRLFWVGQAGAVYLPQGERAPRFVDLLGGRETTIPAAVNGLGAVVPMPVAGRYALLGFTRHAAIDVARDAQGWTATLAQEVEPAQVVGHWARGNLGADGSVYVAQQNGPALLDLRTLQARRIDLQPLMTSLAVPTADADTVYLFGHYRIAGGVEHQALLYSIGRHTLAPAPVSRRLSSTVVYIPSIRRNALRDDFKLTLLDGLPPLQPPIDAGAYLQQLPVVEAAPAGADAAQLAALRAAFLAQAGGGATGDADAAQRAAARAAVLAQAGRGGGGTPVATDADLAALADDAIIETVGVYEADGAVHGAGSKLRTPGTVQVLVKRGKPVILVLTSYEPVNWIIKPDPGAKVAAVLQGGYYASQVYGAGDARIINLGQVYAYRRDRDDFTRLDAEVRQRSGKPVGRFQGSYRGGFFRVGGS